MGFGEYLTTRLDNLLPAPRNRPVPRFAPEDSITLISALDIFGRAVDPAWTGEEIKADTAPEPSDEHLANLAFARVTCEAADNLPVRYSCNIRQLSVSELLSSGRQRWR